MLIDTHAHIYDEAFKNDLFEVIKKADKIGVKKIVLPNIDDTTIEGMHAVKDAYPRHVALMMGLHPCSVNADYKKVLNIIEKHLQTYPYIAVGEIGMDLHWDKTYKKQQEEALLMQCKWAQDRNLPVAIHSRNAIDEICTLLENNFNLSLNGVFHCFTGTAKQAERVLDLGFYLGIGGVLTFKNSDLKNVLVDVPKQKILLETDSPYLAPMPFRGKRNEPAYIEYVADTMAEVWQTGRGEVEKITSTNARQLFKIDNYFEKQQ